VIGGGDELPRQPEVGDVGERQRFQRHPGSDLGGSQQRHPCLVRFATARAGGPPVLELLDLGVDQAEVIADPFHLRRS
jgi:hypothetical protein